MNADNLPADPADTTVVPAAGATTPDAPDPAAGLTPDEERALELMEGALRPAALGLRRRAREGELARLRERYAVGQAYLKIKAQPQVYGPMSDIQLAKFFGADETQLREARRLARRYTPERFEAILAARNPQTGFRLTYDHLAALLKFEDEALADEALALALTDSWTPAQLTAAINRTLRRAAGPRKKAPRPKPDRLPGFLENFMAVTEEGKRQFDEVWDGGIAITAAYDAVPPEKIDRALAERLKDCRGLAEAAAEALASLAREFERLRALAEDTIRRRQRGG